MTDPWLVVDDSTVYAGDCLDVLRGLPDSSIDAIVTDPPYGHGFMGREWDRPGSAARGGKTDEDLASSPYSRGRAEYGGASCGGDQAAQMRAFGDWCHQWSLECLRVLKPGGHMLAFGGTRTWHRLAAAVEDAGFEIRDSIAWLYGSGFPKSLDVSKAIDKAAGAQREIVGVAQGAGSTNTESLGPYASTYDATAPATDDARTWQGWGTALKPAFEPIVVGRKPLAGTVAGNVLAHGTGALNIDACRIAGSRPATTRGASVNASSMAGPLGGQGRIEDDGRGRWPANVLLDGTTADQLDQQTGILTSGRLSPANNVSASSNDAMSGPNQVDRVKGTFGGDSGGASRYFPTFRYEAKAPTSERPRDVETAHPTVKPLDLMRWLVRLVTPPRGTVLDPFAGSGTTGEACRAEGFACVLIEREPSYLPLIAQRLARPTQSGLF